MWETESQVADGDHPGNDQEEDRELLSEVSWFDATKCLVNVFGIVRGGVKKKYCFFYFRSKGGGRLGQSKKSLSENTQIFFDQRGGVSPNPKGFYQKNWDFLA